MIVAAKWWPDARGYCWTCPECRSTKVHRGDLPAGMEHCGITITLAVEGGAEV